MEVLRSANRGYSNHGWLRSHHTFSFADYFNRKYQQFESLRVINEDHVAPGEGFPLHPHSNFEIFSYVISGTIIHRDSMNNVEECSRGDIQFTTAGSGIYHSEFAKKGKEELHFLQIWVKPHTRNLTPKYSTAHISEDEKRNKLFPIILPVGTENEEISEKAIRINQNVKVFASILEKGQQVEYTIPSNHKGYLHIVEKEGVHIDVISNSGDDQIDLHSGDGLFLHSPQTISIKGVSDSSVEFLFFDIEEEMASRRHVH